MLVGLPLKTSLAFFYLELLLQAKIFLIKKEQNQRVPDTYINNDYINAIKFIKMKLKHRIRAENAERRKTSFPKE